MRRQLTESIKNFAKETGADLIGVASLNRWKSAPFNRTPMALMPDASCAIVMGFHYLDACVELGGQPDARIPGPSASNHIASEHGNYTAFKLCKYIEKSGYDALMVPATGWWNYRENDASPRGFSADITHYYAACAAGLGEIGWNNLCMSPEFGPRQRWITVITNAPLEIDPMYDGPKLCDGCKLCERHCPGDAFTKESKGTITVDFDEKTYTFKHKNLWRCALGENFQLDSFMQRPDIIDEQVIKKLCEDWATGSPDNRFSWKMGQCLKWCMTHDRRYFDKTFTLSPRRRRDVEADYSKQGVENAKAIIENVGKQIGVSQVIAVSGKALNDAGIDITNAMPTAQSALCIVQYYLENCEGDTLRQCMRNALHIAKKLEILGGYDTMVESGIKSHDLIRLSGKELCGDYYNAHTIITSIPFEDFSIMLECDNLMKRCVDTRELKEYICDLAKESGADLVGVSSAERIDDVAQQLNKWFEDKEYFISVEQGYGEKANRMIDMKGKPKNPKAVEAKLHAKGTAEYINDAKSVILIGISMLNGSVKNVMKPPAYKGAHYGATVHKEMFYQNKEVALKLCKVLSANGYKAYMTDDLMNIASLSYSFMLPGIRANHIEAVCAGLGVLGKNGMAINEEFASKVRYVAIVTNAELEKDALADIVALKCRNCNKCVSSCPAFALSANESIFIDIEDRRMEIAAINQLKCDWAMRYGLMKESGPKCLGSTNDYSVPEIITRENLVKTIRESDRLQISNFAPIVEKCMIECPYNEKF